MLQIGPRAVELVPQPRDRARAWRKKTKCVAGGGCGRVELGEHGLGAVHVAALEQGLREERVPVRGPAVRLVVGRQLAGAPQVVLGLRQVAAAEGELPR